MSDTTSDLARLTTLRAQFARASENYDLCTEERDWNGCTNYEREMDSITAEMDSIQGNSDDEDPTLDDAAYWESLHEREDGDEDRYLDSSWEDANEYGMEGCCGDF